jgi:hypothetical protein
LKSSALKWPDRQSVAGAAAQCAARQGARRPELPRAAQLDTTDPPVAAGVPAYTPSEQESLRLQPGFGARLDRETVWVDERGLSQ